MQRKSSDSGKLLIRTAWIAAALALCLAAGGCSVMLRAGRAVWHRILPQHTAHVSAGPQETNGPYEGDDSEQPDETESSTQEPEATAEPTEPPQEYVVRPYADIHEIHGTKNRKEYIPATWQRGSSILQSEVMPLDIASVLWNVGYDSYTLEAQTDLDGDGGDEALFILPDGNTALKGVYVQKGDAAVNLLDQVSEEFRSAVAPLTGGGSSLPVDCVVQAFGMDLDSDGTKEILLAIGDDNTNLAVSFLKYTGGTELYREIGGIVGHRLLFVTVDHTLYLPVGNSAYGKYVEFGYDGRELAVIGYNMD